MRASIPRRIRKRFARSADDGAASGVSVRYEAGDLVVVDTATRREFKRLPLGKMPEGVLIPPTGGRAYVAVNGDNHVAVIDLKTWQVVNKISTGTGPDGMAWIN